LLRDQVDLDSMDSEFRRVAPALKVDIPEADYRKLTTLDTLSPIWLRSV
jgi:hypothetical protein